MNNGYLFRRKVQVVGGGTLAITIPKAWAKKHGVEPGSELSIVVNPNGCLTIYPPNIEVRKKVSTVINLREDIDVNTVVRLVIAHYLAGFQSIKLKFPLIMHETIMKSIEILKSKVIGLEILEENSSSATFYITIDPEFMEFEAVTRKIVKVSLSMLQDLGVALKSRDKILLESIIKRDDLVDKLFLLAMKQLSTKISNPLELMHPLEAIYLSIALKHVERVADHASFMALILQSCEGNASDKIISLYHKAVEIYREVVNALISLNVNKAIEIAKNADKVRASLNSIRKSICKTDMCTSHVIESTERILAYSIDIAEVVIDICTIRKYLKQQINLQENA